MRFLIIIYFLVFSISLSAQADRGIRLNSAKAFQGYSLYEGPFDSFLIDNCGKIVHSWEGIGQVDLHPKLLENGNLMYLDNNRLYERDWDNNIVIDIDLNDSNLVLVYEVIKKPNGNYLSVGRRFFTTEEFDAIGYDYTGQTPNRVDVIIEIDYKTEEIIWEWNISDHVIQERDPSAPNYGVIVDHPELINMDEISTFDWTSSESFMINGFDYNSDLEQCVLSVRKMNEIMVIDQSTTTEEAKGSTGGRYGKGGDILYRWGNPQNYGAGSPEDRILYLQHNPNWVKYGPNKGRFIMYNNGFGRDIDPPYSSAVIIDQPQLVDGTYFKGQDAPYLPAEPTVLFDNPTNNINFFSAYTSGATILPNGNIYVTVGVDGQLMEIDPTTNNVVWVYDAWESSYLFRSVKYSKNYEAFQGRELVPSGTAEDPPSDYNCQYYTTSTDEQENFSLSIRQDLEQGIIYIQNPSRLDLKLSLFSINGQLIKEIESETEEPSFKLQGANHQLFLLQILDKKTGNSFGKLVGL